MDITEFVNTELETATEDELKAIVSNGLDIEDDDMREALENEFVQQATERLNILQQN